MDLSSLFSDLGSTLTSGLSDIASAVGAIDPTTGLTSTETQALVDQQGLQALTTGANGLYGFDPSTFSSDPNNIASSMAALGDIGYTQDPTTGAIVPISGGQSAGFLNGAQIPGALNGILGGGNTFGAGGGYGIPSLYGAPTSGGLPSSLLSALGLSSGNPLSDAALLSGGLGALGGLTSAALGSSAANNAAQLQYQAAQNAQNLQQGMFSTIYGNMQPYNAAGQSAITGLGSYAGAGTGALGALSTGLGIGTSNPFTSPLLTNQVPTLSGAPTPTLASGAPGVSPTIGALSAAPQVNPLTSGMLSAPPTVNPLTSGTLSAAPDVARTTSGTLPQFNVNDPSQLPGFNFTLQQGEQAAQNASSATGLGLSGATGKALAQYAEGLAGTYIPTYANIFMNQQGLNLGAQQQAFGQNQQQFTNWQNANALNLGAQSQAFGQQQQGFTNWQNANALNLGAQQQAFGQQQQGFTNWLQSTGQQANFANLNFQQQQQLYSNWLQQQSGLFSQQFGNYNTANSLALNRGGLGLSQQAQQAALLGGLSTQGQNAFSTVGGYGAGSMNPLGAFGGSIGNSLAGLITGGGAALAGGQVGSANALSGGLNNAFGALGSASLTPYLLGAMGNGGGFGGTNPLSLYGSPSGGLYGTG